MHRRTALTASAAAIITAGIRGSNGLISAAPPAETAAPAEVRIGLNTSTLRGQKLSVPEQIDVAGKAGYDAIEPWIRDMRSFIEGGGKPQELRQRFADAGLSVESAIGFANWISEDARTRAAGLEEARRDMALVAAVGGTRIAAPPIGAHRRRDARPELAAIAERYRALLEVGEQEGVVPQLELWGFSPTLSRLGELAYVATEAAHPQACVLPDFYHIYKGGSDFAGLQLIEASRMHVFHINDYPANPPRETIADRDRVYPGDGICPLKELIAGLIDRGFRGCFSLELFNPEYWKQDAVRVAQTGIQKIRDVLPVSV